MKKDKLKKEENNSKELEYYKIYPDEKSRVWLKVVIIVLIIVICLGLFYKFVVWNNKGIISSGINTIYNGTSKAINKLDDLNILNGGNELDGVLTFNTSDTNFKELNDYQYDINGKIDTKSKKLSGSFNILNNSNSIFNVEYNYQNNNQYVNLKNIYDKIIKLNNSDDDIEKFLDNTKDINYDKLKISLKNIKDIINNNIPTNKLESNEEKVNINNNDYNLKYVSLKLTKDEYGKVLVDIKNDIEDNSKLMNNLSEAINVSNDDIKNYLDEFLKDALVDNFNNIEFKVYVNGIMASITGVDVLVDNNSIAKVMMIDNNKELTISNNNCEFNYLNDKVIIKGNNEEVINGNINEMNDNTFDMDYNITYVNGEKYYGNIHVDEEKENDNKIHGKVIFSIVTNKNINYSIQLDYSLINDIVIDDIKQDDVISIDNVSENDYLNMYNKLNDNTKNTIYNQLITVLVSSMLNY